MCFIPALAGENPGLTQLNIDIISEHFNLNITPVQAKMVASVLDMTYKLMGVKDDSLMKFVGRNYPGKSGSYMQTLAKRRIHAIDVGKESDSDDDGGLSRVYKDNDDAGGGDLPQDFVEIMKNQVAAMMESIDAGGNGGSGSPHAAGGGSCRIGRPGVTPIPAEKKRQRSGLLPFGAAKGINMEVAPTPMTIPLLPGGGLPPAIPGPQVFQHVAEA